MPSKSKKTNTLLTAGTLGGIAAVIAAIATLWTAIVPNQPNNNENDSNFSSRFTTADVEGSVFNEINKPIKNAEVVLNNSTSTKMKTDGMGGFLFENVVTNKKHNLSVYDQGTMIFWKYFKIPESQNFFKLDLQTGYIVSPTNPDKSIRNDVKLPVIPINNSENKVQFLNSSSSVAYDIALNQKGYKIAESNLKPGSNQFNFTFWISTDSKTLHKIDKVTYYLHPTFNPQVVTKTSASKNFSISFTGWGTFDIKAKVYFKDGEVKDLIYPATKWTIRNISDQDILKPSININNHSSSSVAYDIALNQKGYKIPESNLKPGSNQFNFTFWISTDSKTLHKIDKVTYYLHPTFNPQVVTKTSASKNFSISFTGWGTFDIKAKVYFKDGEVKDLIYPATKWTK